MDRLTSMGIFIKVADLGSFAAAAAALGLSPQLVAKHVTHLEDRLGSALILRTTRRQSLTDVGRAFYERSRQLVADAEAAEALAQDMRRRPHGLLRVNGPVTFGTYALAPLVARYLASQPEVEIELTLTDRAVDPVEEGFELLVRVGIPPDAGLVVRPLRPYRLIACAAPDYIARRGMPEVPGDLARHDCLTYGAGPRVTGCRWIFSRGGRACEVDVRGRLRGNDWMALLAAAVAGQGVTLGPEAVLAGEIAAGRLVRLLPDWSGPARPMYLLYPAGRRPTAKVQSFVDFVLAEYGAEPAA